MRSGRPPGVSDEEQINAHGREARRLTAEGVPASARLVGARDTGQRLAGNVVLDLELEIALPDRLPYATTVRVPIAGSDTCPYVIGRVYAVHVDPADHRRVALG